MERWWVGTNKRQPKWGIEKISQKYEYRRGREGQSYIFEAIVA